MKTKQESLVLPQHSQNAGLASELFDKRRNDMQFLMYSTDAMDDAAPPSPEMLAEIGAFMEEAFKAGVIVTTGTLQPKGTRIKLSDGKVNVTDGPFIEAKELLGGFAVIQVDTKEEAIEWATRFRKIVGEGETEVVQLFGPG
jgi:hypothetical protein